MKLQIEINKIKSIDYLEVELPLNRGLYAITGQNGSGKSTLATCTSSVFFNMKMKDYFGKTDLDAFIKFDLNGNKRSYQKTPEGRWQRSNNGMITIKGFYEGSLIYGNRFRNTNYSLLRKLELIDESTLQEAPDYIKHNLGYILHNNKHFYEQLFLAKRNKLKKLGIKVNDDLFYYQKNGKNVSQFHMSTGENLLITILHSLNKRNNARDDLSIPCLILLDEIELALHPSSLKRLVSFLTEMSRKFNYSVYFSTHSIEIISSIPPDNIFFLNRHSDNTLEVINPCYPAYATRILYDHSGYDYVILVEDDLARKIIRRLLIKNRLLSSKLIHILPAGGYTNVLELGQEVVSSNLLGRTSKIMIILDEDVKEISQKYIREKSIANNIPVNYLPIESLEKFLRTSLITNVDHKLFRFLDDYVFHNKGLDQIVDEYKNSGDHHRDNSGKKLYSRIDTELRERGKSRDEFVELIVDYLTDNNTTQVNKIVTFLKKQLLQA